MDKDAINHVKGRSAEDERALVDALSATLPVHRLTYQHHWFAGLSDLPGNGVEHVQLARSGEHFVGSAKIEFRDGLGGATAMCSAPISIEVRRLEALFQALTTSKLAYGVVPIVVPDCADSRRISLEAINGKRLTFMTGIGARTDFWGHVPDNEIASGDSEICGVQSPELSAIGTLLDECCGLSAQTTTLWNALKSWSSSRRCTA